MHTVTVPKRSQFHCHQCDKRYDAKLGRRLGVANVRCGCKVFRLHFFAGKNEMNCGGGSAFGPIQKHIHAEAVAMDEPRRFESRFRGSQVLSADQNIDVARVADGVFIDAADPLRDGIAAAELISQLLPMEKNGTPTKRK